MHCDTDLNIWVLFHPLEFPEKTLPDLGQLLWMTSAKGLSAQPGIPVSLNSSIVSTLLALHSVVFGLHEI